MALEHVTKRGKRAKARREELDLTQEDVAERIQELHAERNPGADRDKTRGQMISDYERGINDPRGARLELWAEALEWTVGDLEADKPATDGNDLMDELSAATRESALEEAVSTLTKQVKALETQLSADLGKVQKALEAQQTQLEHVVHNRATGAK